MQEPPLEESIEDVIVVPVDDISTNGEEVVDVEVVSDDVLFDRVRDLGDLLDEAQSSEGQATNSDDDKRCHCGGEKKPEQRFCNACQHEINNLPAPHQSIDKRQVRDELLADSGDGIHVGGFFFLREEDISWSDGSCPRSAIHSFGHETEYHEIKASIWDNARTYYPYYRFFILIGLKDGQVLRILLEDRGNLETINKLAPHILGYLAVWRSGGVSLLRRELSPKMRPVSPPSGNQVEQLFNKLESVLRPKGSSPRSN